MIDASRLAPSRADAVALVAGVAAVAGSFAAVGRTPEFLASPVERAFSRAMPGEVVAFAITVLGDLGQQLNLVMATLLLVGLVAILTRGAILLGERANNRAVGPLGAAVGTYLLGAVLLGDLALPAAAALPAGATVLLARLARARWSQAVPLSTPRRRALATVGAAVGVGVTGYAVGADRGEGRQGADLPAVEGPNVDQEAIQRGLDTAERRELDVPEVDPLVSRDHYTVSINAVDPAVDRESWSLDFTGAVESEVTVDYEDLLAMPAENRFVTLRCVGENLNGIKMDTALWTGVAVDDLLDRAGPTSDCNCVLLRGADDYFVEFPLDALRDGLLAYGMNGHVLPRGNGYPVRTLVPGHWGEVNAKWVTEVEFIEQPMDGYWERRGWHGTGPVVPVAKLHTAETRIDGTRVVGGRAYAGTRGIERVEVSTDGGDTWTTAELSGDLRFPDDPALGEPDGVPHDAWRQWAHTYDPPDGRHTVVVRLVDGNGDVQPSEERDQYPRGPSGWVSRTFEGGGLLPF